MSDVAEPNGAVPSGSTVGEQLGVGANWQPGPGSWNWHDLHGLGPTKAHVLVVRNTGGTLALVFDDDGLRRFVAQATERLSGLHIAAPGDVPPAL